MVLELYVMPVSAPCRSVLMLVHELGLEVQIKHIDLMKGEQHSEEFLQINPFHTVPTLYNPETGFALWESRAIMQYLINLLAPNHSLYPETLEQKAQVDKMLYYDSGTLSVATSAMIGPLIFTEATEIDEQAEKKFKSKMQMLEKILDLTAYVAGDMMTLADLSIYATITQTDVIDYDLSNDFPNVTNWKERICSEIGCDPEVNEEPLGALKQWLQNKKADIEKQE